jgi:arginyl-tRNA synthetase
MLQDSLREVLAQSITKLWPSYEVGELVLEKPSEEKFGDYATSIVFKLAKTLQKNPKDIAEKLRTEIVRRKKDFIDRIEVAGNGYLNFFLAHDVVRKELQRIATIDIHTHKMNIGEHKTVIVEYPSTNIAKPMHVGHSRTVFIGDALANIYDYLGYEVIRWDYLGDWGTAFGKLIAAYKKWGVEREVIQKPIQTLLQLYVRFSAEAKTNPELEQQARDEFKKLEDGDVENRKLWEWFKKESLKESYKLYTALQMHPSDIDIGESFYEKDMKPLVEELLEKKIAHEDEGAVAVSFPDTALPNALLQKSDGASLYLTRDIANVRYRLSHYHPTKILYVVANQQALHFEQLFAITKMLGLESAELTHVKFGLVLGNDHKKLATREGNAVELADVVREGMLLTRKIVEEKNTTLNDIEKDRVAHVVTVGALKYNDLKENRNSDIVFDWERMLDVKGNSGPYLQYTYARMRQILHKAGERGSADTQFLIEPVELRLIKHLFDFDDVVMRSAHLYMPHYLALYLYELANAMNQMYEGAPILKDDNSSRRDARLLLIETASNILKRGLGLLGIEALEQI